MSAPSSDKQCIIALIPTELPALVASAGMRYCEGGKTAQDASCRRENFQITAELDPNTEVICAIFMLC